MVESAVFFLIGFLCAALVAILAIPVMARRAMRLATARARLQAPLSESQARADRDALRGQHAVELVRLEKRASATELSLAESRIENGKQSTQIVELTELSEARWEDILSQRKEIADLSRDLVALRTETGARELALWDLMAQRDAANVAFARARALAADREATIDQNRIVMASQETRISSLGLELSDLRAASAAERARLSAALEERRSAAQHLEGSLEEAEAKAAELEGLLQARATELAGISNHAAELEARLSRSEAGRADLTVEAGRQLARIAELSTAGAARDELAERLETATRRWKQAEDALKAQVQSLTTAKAASEGALAVERAARNDFQRQLENLQRRLEESKTASESVARGDAALRLSIAKLGREILRTRAPQENEAPSAAQIVSFTRRDGAPPMGSAAEAASADQRDDQPIASGG